MGKRGFIFLSLGLILIFIMVEALAQKNVSLPRDMKNYRHINTLVVPVDSSIHGIHHFYINVKGLETFKSEVEGDEYPTGTKIIGKVYKVVETGAGRIKEGDLAAFTYMEKAPKVPVTKDTGGWIFAKFDAKGNRVQIDPVKDCFQCHRPHSKSDFVLSEPLQ